MLELAHSNMRHPSTPARHLEPMRLLDDVNLRLLHPRPLPTEVTGLVGSMGAERQQAQRLGRFVNLQQRSSQPVPDGSLRETGLFRCRADPHGLLVQ